MNEMTGGGRNVPIGILFVFQGFPLSNGKSGNIYKAGFILKALQEILI